MPRGLTGAYYVFVLTDVPSRDSRGVVFEGGSEANNATPSDVPMLIELPPPADLQVQDIVEPDDAFSGELATILWTVSNTSTETITGLWDDSVYLSADAVWDLGDRLIGRVQQGDLKKGLKTLLPDESYTAELAAPLPTSFPDNYRIVVRTDIFDDVHEGPDNANNAFTSADTVQVRVKDLQFEIVQADDLSTGEELLYRILAPANETLRIDLTSESPIASNELYVRYEGLPNSIQFDAAFEGLLFADQTAIVPNTSEGYYYILARGTSSPADNPVELAARLLPFGITSISRESGGDGRFVTFDIRGAKVAVCPGSQSW